MLTTMKGFTINSKGSFTVEASIVFSVVFLLMAAIVYVFIIMYQYTFVQSITNEAANVGAYYYVNPAGINYNYKSNSNLYWRIVDTESDNKKSILNSSIEKKLDQSIINPPRYVQIDTSYKSLIKQLNISIEEQYPLPIDNLFTVFGISPTLSLRAEAITPLDDNAEFIRNMDTVIDIKNCILNSDNKWIGKDSKVNEVIGKLLKKK